MAYNYTTSFKKITSSILLLACFTMHAQNIEFTFSNAQITNDGIDDYYEVDVMMAAIDGLADFKLGSGLLYINYNTASLGPDIASGGVAEVTYPNPDYILGDVNVLDYYTSYNLANNTTSRIAFSFQQGLSSGGMVDNVTATPKKLFHLKIKYIDSGLDPMIVFEDNETQPPGVNDSRDQFSTACGPSGSFALADCNSEPGTQFLDAIFNSSGATLSTKDFKLLTGLSIYPNPTRGILYIDGDVSKLKTVDFYSISGQHVMKVTDNFKEIDMSSLKSAIYFMKLNTDETTGTFKVVKH